MTMSLRAIGIWLAVGQLAACSSTIHQPFEIDGPPPKSLSIDAKQRVILVTDKGGPEHNKHVACAEPSPDVFVAAAASGSASVDVAKKSGETSGKYVESAASLSRGHTIQLLRDGLYRACEAYMNGALGQNDYRNLLTFYDITMIATLAIEGVTQPKIPGSTTIGGVDPDKAGGGAGAAGGNPPPDPAKDAGGKPDPAPDEAAAAQATEMLKAYFDTKLKLFDAVHKATIEMLQMQMKGK
jgi:hypothetical protein